MFKVININDLGIKNGSIPLIHPKWHEFVNRTHDSNKSIYVRKYMPEK